MQTTTRKNRRLGLRPYEGQRITIIGIFQCHQTKRNGQPVVCIRDLHMAGTREWLCNHAWLDGFPFLELGLQHGDYLKFTSRVHRKNGRFFVTWATRVKVVNNERD